MKVSFKLQDWRQMHQRMQALAHRYPSRIRDAVLAEATTIMDDSKANYVPVDSEDLKNSGRVRVLQRDNGRFSRTGTSISVELIYGESGPAREYALTVHEHPSIHSPAHWSGVVSFSPPGHGPKYLERPLRAAVRGMPGRLAERLRV